MNSKPSELASKNEINTPVRREILRVMSENRQFWAENAILKRRLAEAEMIIDPRQECKSVKRNCFEGQECGKNVEELKKQREGKFEGKKRGG